MFYHHHTSDCHDFVDFARTPGCRRSNTHGWLSHFRTTTWSIGEVWIAESKHQTRSCMTKKYPLSNILFVAQPFGFGEFAASEIKPRNYIMFKVSGLQRLQMRATIANASASDVKLRWESAFDSGCRVLGVLAKTAEPRAVVRVLASFLVHTGLVSQTCNVNLN